MNPTVKLKRSEHEYDCNSGPRPPALGEESSTKMTDEDACNSSSNLNRSPTNESVDLSVRIANWQRSFTFILDDQEGIKLLYKYVENDAGKESIDYARLRFYFACRGLKTQTEPDMQRRLITAIYGILKKQNWIHVSTELRNTIRKIQKEEIQPDPNIFNELQDEVEKTISDKIYPSFFSSSVFIDYAEEVNKQSVINVKECRAGDSTVATNISDSTTISGEVPNDDLMPNTTSLQTLHEDVELKLNESVHPSKSGSTHRSMPKLTSDLLLATQKKRLEVRPSGAHGYTYNVFNMSFNPVSRQDSERQSCSSASLTDSDVNSKDGKPFFHRRPSATENVKSCYMNTSAALPRSMVKPLAQGLKENVEPISKSRMEQSSFTLEENKDYFIQRLLQVKKEREQEEKAEQFSQILNDRLTSQTLKSTTQKIFPDTMVKPNIEEDGQSILDQHVSRVFSPPLGTTSPHYSHRTSHHRSGMTGSMPDFGMRTSRSIPEHASELASTSTMRKVSYGHSNNAIDSGISLYSADLPYRPKMGTYSEDTLRRSEDEPRRMRKQMSIPQQFSHSVNIMQSSSSHHSDSLPRLHDTTDEYTYVVYTFGDDKIPFRSKIPGKRITLKQFKDHLPKKGNFRYFFKVNSDDPDNPVLNEEIVDDMDVLPFFEGKIMGMISDS